MLAYFFQYIADFTATISYSFAKRLNNNQFYSISEVFAYSNIYIVGFLITLSPILKKKYNINIYNIRHYLKNKQVLYATFLSVLSSYVKTILLSHLFGFTQLTLRSYTMLSPFLTLFLCHFFLKDQKLSKKILLAFIISFAGSLIFNYDKNLNITFSLLPTIYLCLNAYSDYKLKSVSKDKGIEMALFDNLMFTFLSISVFLIASFNSVFTQKVFGISIFQPSKLINFSSVKCLFVVSVLSFIAHNCKMFSFKNKHIAGLLIFGLFAKMINSIAITYIDYKTLLNTLQTIGLILILIGGILFVVKKNNNSVKNNSTYL